MKETFQLNNLLKIPTVGKIPLYIIIVFLVFVLAVLQDYIYSRLQQTGYYLSESLLYNTFWIFFIPLTLIAIRITYTIKLTNKWLRILVYLVFGTTLSILNIFLFTLLFVGVSHMIFSPPHKFGNIFNAALSNQLYIALLWYSIFPAIYVSKLKQTKQFSQYPDKIKLKVGSKITSVPTSAIQLISTDKPYSTLITHDQKFLDDKSLKEFESLLDPNIFLRVHRSAIINSTFIKEVKSRNNGDYDATLENNEVVRLSRHFRDKWSKLLQ